MPRATARSPGGGFLVADEFHELVRTELLELGAEACSNPRGLSAQLGLPVFFGAVGVAGGSARSDRRRGAVGRCCPQRRIVSGQACCLEPRALERDHLVPAPDRLAFGQQREGHRVAGLGKRLLDLYRFPMSTAQRTRQPIAQDLAIRRAGGCCAVAHTGELCLPAVQEISLYRPRQQFRRLLGQCLQQKAKEPPQAAVDEVVPLPWWRVAAQLCCSTRPYSLTARSAERFESIVAPEGAVMRAIALDVGRATTGNDAAMA